MGTRIFNTPRAPRLGAILLPAAILLTTVLCTTPVAAQEASLAQIATVDSLFQNVEGTKIPGCAVGVSQEHAIVLERTAWPTWSTGW